MTAKKFTPDDVTLIAKLANIPVTPGESVKLAYGFNSTMLVVDNLFKVDVTHIEPIYQVTGLENVMREDDVDIIHQFTQEQALLNAKRTYNGFFVVDQVLEQE
jgi:aspartyl/glutamyl-tRNA(Asn/Gln) amidotransferase C subunit